MRHDATDMTTTGFDDLRVLGKGSFGVVRLVSESAKAFSESGTVPQQDGAIASKPLYAMKVIRKSKMLRTSQEAHLRAERDCLVAAEGARWIVPLLAAFQDKTNLYLVMDYMVGGDFLGLLLREDVLEEGVARWYVAEMVLCVEEAHRLRWIHRDIKPDNFLIGSDGHLKISDFGLAFDGHWSHSQSYHVNQRMSLMQRLGLTSKKQDSEDCLVPGAYSGHEKRDLLISRDRKERRRLARSIVGTSQYMAPEVILGYEYDGRCD